MPEEVRADLEFILVENMDQVLEHALDAPGAEATAEPTPAADRRRRPPATRTDGDDRHDRHAAGDARDPPTRPALFTPGPVEIPARILRALSQVPPHHRTDVFRETLQARDRGAALAARHRGRGVPARRLGHRRDGGRGRQPAVARRQGAGARPAASSASAGRTHPQGVRRAARGDRRSSGATPIDPAAVASARSTRDPSISAVFTTHSETSTGSAARPRGDRARSRARADALLVVDAHHQRRRPPAAAGRVGRRRGGVRLAEGADDPARDRHREPRAVGARRDRGRAAAALLLGPAQGAQERAARRDRVHAAGEPGAGARGSRSR